MKKYFFLVFLAFSMISCSSNKDRALHESVSAFLSDNPFVIAFGKIDVQRLLTKADYQTIPKIGVVAKNYLEELKPSLNVNSGVYYAVKLSDSLDLSKTVTPTLYAFFEVKNPDSLKLKLSQQGVEIDQIADISYFHSSTLCVGFRDKLGILIAQDNSFDSKSSLEKAFKQTTGDLSSDKLTEQLTRKDDIFISVNLEHLRGITPKSTLSKSQRDEPLEVLKDTYLATSITIQQDAIVIRSMNLFTPALKQKIFLASDDQASIRSSLGGGKPTMGLSANVDMKKFSVYLNDISPVASTVMERSVGKGALFLMSPYKNDLSAIFSGKAGVACFNRFSSPEEKPNVKVVVGLGKKGAPIGNLATLFLGNKFAVMKTDKTGLFASTLASTPTTGRLELPSWCDHFGKKGITGFVDIEALDPALFQRELEPMKLIKYITIEADENESVIVIKAKKGKENLLKQAVDFFVQKFMMGQGEVANS